MTDFRVGHGYDVHRLIENRPLVLCGVTVPYTLGLLGHSDADVATHALCDALLGAAALGDIGLLFPDNDPEYENIYSINLLVKVTDFLHSKGFSVGNADITVIAERPKLRPYIDEMRGCIAKALNVDVSRISVKATTEEGLGFTGAKVGIAAHAVALIYSEKQ